MKGNVWKFANDIDTDAIIPGRYLTINTADELAQHAFEGVRPDFASNVKSGDMIIAGTNFGCGSSREHAPLALTGAGVKCIIAKSFARIFFRNSINIGLMLMECPDTDSIREGDEQDMELGYELRRAINHADNFAKTDVQTSLKIIEELLKLEKMKPEIAYRLADIMPSSFDEIRSIYAKERFSLDEKELIQILDIITDTH